MGVSRRGTWRTQVRIGQKELIDAPRHVLRPVYADLVRHVLQHAEDALACRAPTAVSSHACVACSGAAAQRHAVRRRHSRAPGRARRGGESGTWVVATVAEVHVFRDAVLGHLGSPLAIQCRLCAAARLDLDGGRACRQQSKLGERNVAVSRARIVRVHTRAHVQRRDTWPADTWRVGADRRRGSARCRAQLGVAASAWRSPHAVSPSPPGASSPRHGASRGWSGRGAPPPPRRPT